MNQPEPTIQRIAELQQFIANFSRIERVPQLADTGRRENDVDHSFGLALTCWFLAPKIAPDLDLAKILTYALAHDTVEIYAGDTYVWADKALLDSKSAREDAAIQSLARDWSDFPELANSAQGYKEHADEEAKFVYAIDKILPTLMINLGEKSAFWTRHKITLEMEKTQKRKMLVSDYAAPYYDRLIQWVVDSDYCYKESD